MRKFCGNRSDSDDLSLLECLHSLHPDDLSTMLKPCQQMVWDATSNLIKDENVVSTLLPLCRNDMDKLNCKRDDGDYFKCLASRKDTIEDAHCLFMIQRIENVAFTDYKFLATFLKQCEADVRKLNCGTMDSQGISQIATIACLQTNILLVTENCKSEVFRLSELQSDNIKLDQTMYLDCAEDYSKYCSQFPAGSGRVFHCLARQNPQKLSNKCKTSLIRRQGLISQDYKVSKGLMRSCRDDIKKTHCRKQTSSDRTVRLAQILLCLENLIRNGTYVSSDCQAELVEHRRMLMEDYRLSPEIVDKCKKETVIFCREVETGGKTIHCLMKYAKETKKKDAFSPKCREAVNAGENWQVDPVLRTACAPVVDKLCSNFRSGHGSVMICLMDNIGAEAMTEDCETVLMQIQYFVARKFELDEELYRTCKDDAFSVCSANAKFDSESNIVFNSGVLSCLYRQFRSEYEDKRLNDACLANIQRVMKQRAVSVDLQPSIEEACLDNLATFCYKRVEKGEEMNCLQDHYNDLDEKCKDTIELFTELQSQHAELNPYINKHCTHIINTLCMDHKSDEGSIMDCLISQKNNQIVKLDQACRASIEHFQLISLQDYRFSYKFKVACKPYVIRYCNAYSSKFDVIRCLSEQIVNATINKIKSNIPRDCRQQLKAQLFQQRENINMSPVLKAACRDDIRTYCANVVNVNGEVLECLQSGNIELKPACHKEVFRIEKQEAYDNSVDYALLNMCAGPIEMFCSHVDKENVLECLRKHKDQKGFNKKCSAVLMHRILEQNSNSLLNPTLQENCHMDISKFCSHLPIPQGAKAKGVVISCLKKQFKMSKLTDKCEKEIASILREQALNLNLNPLIRTLCKNELQIICKIDEYDDNSGNLEECLKDALINKKIQTPECNVEVANMIEESQADIQVDPLLQQACALDLLQYCSEIAQGNGRHVNCLKLMMDKKKKLSTKCKNMLTKRFEMYKNAALIAPMPLENFEQLYHQVTSSPSRQYFFLITLEPIKYNPNDRRTPKMLYSKKQYNEKVKVDNWYMNIEFQPVDINPYNPKCFRLHNSHYNRLGNLDQKTLISEDHDCYRNVSPKTSHFEHNPHKFLINAYSYPYSCPNDQSKQSCPQNDADFTTTMQRSYSSPYPSKIRR
ncbi:hypothetical protein D910_06509, partial [Dendroctonus ponderosae]